MELAGHGPGQRHLGSRAGGLNCLLYQAEAPGRREQHSNAEAGMAKQGRADQQRRIHSSTSPPDTPSSQKLPEIWVVAGNISIFVC